MLPACMCCGHVAAGGACRSCRRMRMVVVTWGLHDQWNESSAVCLCTTLPVHIRLAKQCLNQSRHIVHSHWQT